MLAALSNLVRVFIAIAMGLGFVAWMPGGVSGNATAMRPCGCSMCAGQPACCAVPEEPSPAQQPAAPASRDSSEGQPLTLADRPMMMIQIPEEAVAFPDLESVQCATVAGHSFHSVRCMWMV